MKKGFVSVTIEMPADIVKFLDGAPGGSVAFVESATKNMLKELFDEAKNGVVMVSLRIPKGAEDAAKKLGIPLETLCRLVFAVGAESLLDGITDAFKTEGSC